MSYECSAKAGSFPSDDMNPELVYERMYWQIHGRGLREAEYRIGPFADENSPFDEGNKRNVESACHRQYEQAIAISKMSEAEFVEGVMKHFAKEKAEFDEERMHRQLRILKTIPRDLIKAHLSMGADND